MDRRVTTSCIAVYLIQLCSLTFPNHVMQTRTHALKAGMFASQGGLWTQADAAYTEATYGADTIARVRKVLDQYDPNRKFGDIDNLLCSLKRQNE